MKTDLFQACGMEYYSAIRRNAFELLLMRWMNPEPIMQWEVSQKGKDKYHILTHIHGICKNGTDELFCKAEQSHRCRKKTVATKGRRGGMEDWWDGLGD